MHFALQSGKNRWFYPLLPPCPILKSWHWCRKCWVLSYFVYHISSLSFYFFIHHFSYSICQSVYSSAFCSWDRKNISKLDGKFWHKIFRNIWILIWNRKSENNVTFFDLLTPEHDWPSNIVYEWLVSPDIHLLHQLKQVQLGFSRRVKHEPAEFRVDPSIEVKDQTEVKVMWHAWAHSVVILTKISHDRSRYVPAVANLLQG